MVGDENDTQCETSFFLAKKVLKPVTERQVLFDFAELVFVSDTVVLNAHLPLLPLSPQLPHAATSLFIATSVFLNHGELAIHITLKYVVVLNKVSKAHIIQNVRLLPDVVQVVDQVGIEEFILVSERPQIIDQIAHRGYKLVSVIVFQLMEPVDLIEEMVALFSGFEESRSLKKSTSTVGFGKKFELSIKFS